ncbi:glycoside hydrolase family 2 [Mucilaginibacter sp. RS28]|uniref:beta-galactosidase n=1 Tax=Mucilaginibacter straminoryzae TaxID=2932774 RepID=A0A9X1X5K5_9SPHI|nr:glycoside hydrolase family 2 TIM barrel-domain containing protein [Mucilaginibacter straminoryzae]MCJ8210013.1 glycoside hydrolase family 2 [Mucilaginibacter straminoryzae]
MLTRLKIAQFITACTLLLSVVNVLGQKTQRVYLSGTGSDHTVKWDFFCTAGRNSGKWTTIPVPSNWELQGFGKYNYGLDKDSLKGREEGLYKYNFKVQASWKGNSIQIVFEGSMTDTEVKINGQSVGAIHQGSFYCFKYDITPLLKYGGDNLLEVRVAKYSANKSVNDAERKGDFWVFGGIYRPVYLEAAPAQHIRSVAVDAKADGQFKANLKLAGTSTASKVTAQIYTLTGQKVGAPFTGSIAKGDTVARIQGKVVNPKLWTPEMPNLYNVVFTLSGKAGAIHTVTQRFGFRTIELRERDGIYVNNVKIKFKGVNHHSFWPTTGRTTNKTLSIEDVKLMKDMNMNAVRMSHYPPDDHFLDVCDSLGLFVLDELCGWHNKYDTPTGSKLVHEMIEHDVNHPSIVMWDNGNEGGFNFELDHWFDELDIQKRPLIHPWAVFRGTDTQHYINYDYGAGTHLHGHDIVFPTEFLHGLYDGGHGAGLDDYWEQMYRTPLSAGGFLWVFADEAVVRTDRNGELDADGDHGPDGIVGPYHEKEGSYYTIKEVWSPVYLAPKEITPAFDGKLTVQNRFIYTNLKQCSFTWKLASFDGPHLTGSKRAITGGINAPEVAPGHYGELSLKLPTNWKTYDVLYVTAFDPARHELFTWSMPITLPAKMAAKLVDKSGAAKPEISETDSIYRVKANGVQLEFSRNNGVLMQVKNGKGNIPFNNGPVLSQGQAQAGFQSLSHRYEGNNLIIEAQFGKKTIEKELKWTIHSSGIVQLDVKYFPTDYEFDYMGVNFSFPESQVKGITYLGSGPYRVWKNRLKGTSLGVWNKPYNNTITGQGNVIYPEFKGYYSNLYWVKLQNTSQPVTIYCASEDVYLRLFTPANPKNVYNTAPPFPVGDISFMHAIPAIGTKSQKAENTGPAGIKNRYYDYSRDPEYAKPLTLYFDFSGNE